MFYIVIFRSSISIVISDCPDVLHVIWLVKSHVCFVCAEELP